MPPIDVTATTTSLLEGLQDATNAATWATFDGRYRPVLVGFARALGLTAQDAADAAQETLIRFSQEYREGKYDPSRGRLRHWLIGIAKYRIADIHRRRTKANVVGGDSLIEALPDANQMTELWDAELRQKILADAFERLHESTNLASATIEAFRLQVLEQVPAAEVAERLKISVPAVYMAKHHCLDKLRAFVAELNAAYEVL